MANTSKAKGSLFEAGIMNYLRGHGFDVERLRQHGTTDEGDLVVRDGSITVVEAKAEQRYDLPRYLKELAVEKANYAKHRKLHEDAVNGVVIVKRRQASIGECFVIQTVDEFFAVNQKGK